ncbi:MAG: RtcB family protein [Bacteroidales bacterium]|jgi:tRNA-splicing ligase RtcB|nr:RtcB family protein [Bacteroidales bacterium]NLM91617.1 RtcB family protein [Bacteroidales bacterium]
MIREIKDEPLPIKMWLNDIKPGALMQARNLARLPFAFSHIALMPDCHEGFGMPIGGVLATRDVIIPNAVGVDIGCGMCAVQTSLSEIDPKTLKGLMAEIRELVPLGFKHHGKPQDEKRMPSRESRIEMPVVNREYESATYQIGTLGGGNHFIEVQKGSDGQFWIMVHSGSRNIGKQVADYYNRLAIRLNEQWKSNVPRSAQLAWLPVDSKEGRQYLSEMNYCIEFALANRRLMMDNILSVFGDQFKGAFRAAPLINIAHNFAALESHFGQEVMVHRKGATRAGKDTTGIIPGSQGANSYIVKGKGNPQSFESCSHGAGRKMGRKEAIRSLDLKKEIKKLDDQGIFHALRSAGDLEEAPGAYKDIQVVMKNQDDLVDILVELKPLAVIKG